MPIKKKSEKNLYQKKKKTYKPFLSTRVWDMEQKHKDRLTRET